VKKKILELLPGSQVILYGRGETHEFGAKAQNRRVGIKVTPGVAGVAPGASTAKGETGKGEKEEPTDDSTKGTPGPKPDPEPPFTLPPLTLPPLRPPTLLDWSEMRAPFTARGCD
jgi:hypothetical protein